MAIIISFVIAFVLIGILWFSVAFSWMHQKMMAKQLESLSKRLAIIEQARARAQRPLSDETMRSILQRK